MAASVLRSFLVGIGFDVDKKSERDANSAIDGVKKSAIKLGATVTGGLGVKAILGDFQQTNSLLGRLSDVLGISADDIGALGEAFQAEGGTLQDGIAALATIDKLRRDLANNGDASFVAPAALAGLDPNTIINAKSSLDALLSLSDQFKNLSTGQRISAAEALGLDQNSILVLSQGEAQLRAVLKEYSNARQITEEMTDATRRLEEQWNRFTNAFGGEFIDPLLTPFFENLADLVEFSTDSLLNKPEDKAGGFFSENKDSFVDFNNTALDFYKEGFNQIYGFLSDIPNAAAPVLLNTPILGVPSFQTPSAPADDRPINLKSEIVLKIDEREIGRVVDNKIGLSAEQAAQDLNSNEAG